MAWLFLLAQALWGLRLGVSGMNDDDARRRLSRSQREVAGLESRLQQLSASHEREVQALRQLETVLVKGKKEWELTFDTITDLIFVVDGAGVISCKRGK